MEAKLKFIGKINSPLKKLEDCPLQEFENAPEGELVIYSEFQEAMKDIAIGSKLLLLTWLHMSDRNVMTTKPRNNPKAKMTVFSTRSPDRPNPIGMHTVNVLGISSEGIIKVSGLEVLDQTPLVDIKPLL